FGALLTKVGIYSIIRVFTLIFVFETDLTHTIFVWIAGLSMIFVVIGALSTKNIKLIVAYNVIPSIGFILFGLAIFNQDALSDSVYYLLHDMIIKAALFLFVVVVVYVAGTSDLRNLGGLIHNYPGLGWILFLSAFILALLHSLYGFIGKVLLFKVSFSNDQFIIGLVAHVSSLLILYSIMKIFNYRFWGDKQEDLPKKSTK